MTSLVIGLVGKRRYGRTTCAKDLKASFEKVGVSCFVFDNLDYFNPWDPAGLLKQERSYGSSVVIYTWLDIPPPEVAQQTDVIFMVSRGRLTNVLQDKTGDSVERMIDYLGECELTQLILVPLAGLIAPTVVKHRTLPLASKM